MKKRRLKPMDEFRLSLTSMLDLVFNILAFFVMTYVPPLASKDFEVNLPPPKPTGQGEATLTPESFTIDDATLFNDLTIRVFASDTGDVARILVESKEIKVRENFQSLVSLEIQRVARAVGGIEAINLVFPPNLKYRHLIEVIEACEKAGIRQINFAGEPPAVG